MSTNEVIFEVLQASGLNWTVNKMPLQTESGIIIPNTVAAVRNDNDAVLGVVGSKYQVMQNYEMAHTIMQAGAEAFDKDSEIKYPWNFADTLGGFGNMGGGTLKGGEAVFMQLQLADGHIGNSDIRRYITVTNFHNGKGTLGFGTSNQVVCCANTFAIAAKDLRKFKHTANLQERVDQAADSLKKMLVFEERQMEVFAQASERRFDKKHIEEMVSSVFNIGLNTPKENVSTRTKNQMQAFAGDLNTSIDEQGETLWTLFNAVTRYTNHTRASKHKDFSLMLGDDAKINERAFNTMLGWLEIDRKELIEA